MHMYAFCLITLQPNEIWCEFLNNLCFYKIFMIVDDNNFNLTYFSINYTNITFIKVENEKCDFEGYKDLNFAVNKLISGWDKALYYFGVENLQYDFVWFVEDDVFFYNEDTLKSIDIKYFDEDLLCNDFVENSDGNKSYWHWQVINIQHPPPYYNGMMCACRLSKKLLESINYYAKTHKKLFFLEALFPTIAIKNNLKCNNPEELKEIHYRCTFDKEDINKNNLYHPVKDLYEHIFYREEIYNYFNS